MHHLHLNNWLFGDAPADILFELLLLNARAFVLLLSCLLILRFIKGSAAVRHLLVSAALAAVALLPLTSQLIPAVDVTIETTYLQESGVEAEITSPAPVAADRDAPAMFTIDTLFAVCLAVYFLGFTIILAGVLRDNLKLLSLVRQSSPVTQKNWLDCLEKHRLNLGIRRHIGLRHSGAHASPSTCGAFRPVILLPDSALQWPDHLIESTLLHELAHIKRYDWLVQQTARCICAFYWLNPLCRIAANRIFVHAETACDDLALNAGVPNLDYAECLVDVAEQALRQRNFRLAALAMASHAGHSQLGDRILTIMNRHACRTPVTKMQIATCLSVFLCVLLPLASVRATLVERVVQPPGPVIFKARLARFSFPYEEQMSPIPVTILPKHIPFEKIAHEKPVTAAEPDEVLAELRRILDTNRAPPRSTAAATPAKDEPGAVHDKNAPRRQIEQTGIASADGNESVNKYIQKTLSGMSRALADRQSAAGGPPIETVSIVMGPTPINMVIPEYPFRALTRGVEGEVVVEYSLDEQGRVVEADIVSAEPSTIFNRHVLKAIKDSTFTPRKVDGKPAPAEGLIEKYVFVLET